MDQAFVERTEQFLKDTFSNSVYLQAHPTDGEYRIQHSYRVANLAKYIAQQEGLDVTDAVIAGLLHDIAYCEEMPTPEAQRNHGRRSAAIARTFLEQQGLDPDRINTICYAIAIWMIRQISPGNTPHPPTWWEMRTTLTASTPTASMRPWNTGTSAAWRFPRNRTW